jgi:hypothetical protein
MSLFSPHVPQRNTPNAPTGADPAIQAAQMASVRAAEDTYGRQATVLTGGAGVTTPATVAKKSLLGA